MQASVSIYKIITPDENCNLRGADPAEKTNLFSFAVSVLFMPVIL